MTASTTQAEDKKTWLYAFVILLLVSLWMVTMRLMNISFLALDFEAALVYLPTILAGIVAFYVGKKQEKNPAIISETF